MILSVSLYSCHFVHTILSIPFCPMTFCPYTILSLPFCPRTGLSNELVNRLQSVLCSASRLVLRRRKRFDPISDDLRNQLHWLPIRQRIQYKLGVLVYKCLHIDAS